MIDDDPIALATSATILHDLGYQVAAYSSAEKFLETYTPAARRDQTRRHRHPYARHGRRATLPPPAHKKQHVKNHFRDRTHREIRHLKLGQLHNVSILLKPFSLAALQNLIIELETKAALKSDAPMT